MTVLLNLDFFEVANGFSGMKRDIVLKICRTLWWKVTDVRVIIGMCREHYNWKKHSYFLNGRPEEIRSAFRANPLGGCIFEGMCCRFTDSDRLFGMGRYRTVFLDVPITEGIFRWVVQIKYGGGKECSESLGMGTAPSDRLHVLDGRILGDRMSEGVSGSCCLSMDVDAGTPRLRLFGMDATEPNCAFPPYYSVVDRRLQVPDHAVVTLEADTTAATVVFFVETRRLPYAFSRVLAPLHMGMTGFGTSSFTSLSLRRLPSAPLCPSTSCRYFRCRAKD